MKKIFFLATLIILALPLVTFAIDPGTIPTADELGLENSPVQSVSEGVDLLASTVKWVYLVFFVLTVLFILLAAYDYLTGAGEPEKIKTAHKKLVYAVVAIIVALMAVGFQAIVKNFLENPGTGSVPDESLPSGYNQV